MTAIGRSVHGAPRPRRFTDKPVAEKVTVGLDLAFDFP
jgi:hypothetical protein